MPQFTFKHEGRDFCDRTFSTISSFDVTGLNEVLENFELFLRGCGYVFNGKVEIVNAGEGLVKEDKDEV